MKIITTILLICVCWTLCVSAGELTFDLYRYEIEGDKIILTGITDDSLNGKLSVPAYIEEKQVKRISGHAFSYMHVNEIELKDGIEDLSAHAITDCLNLKKIIIPASCKTLGGASYMPAIEYCENLETIEIYGDYESLPLFVADCPDLKNIVFHGDVKNITNEFKYNFYNCEPRVKRVNPRNFTEPLHVTIQGKKGSNIEKFAIENGFKFESLQDETPVSKNPYAIAKLEKESFTVMVHEIIDTDFGTVMYYDLGGMPHGPDTRFLLVDYEGNEYGFEGDPVPYATGYGRAPVFENLKISDDGRYLTFSVSFNDRLVVTFGDTPQVLHDAGTYSFKCDLKEHTKVETRFEPLDTISEDVISAWAKPEVESAIELGFVPLSIRDNYRRNITREEFASLAMFFLEVQYGYEGAGEVLFWSPVEVSDSSFFSREFINAYCHSRTDRNGNPFKSRNDEGNYVYNNSSLIFLPDAPFQDAGSTLIRSAYHIGIVNGISETEFNPNGEITRQEAAAMLMRVYNNYAEFEGTGIDFTFSDDEKISDWAKEDVYNINALGIMQGVGENVFAPLEGYTVEQAIVTFWRLYDSAPISRKNKNITPLLEHKFELENYFNRAGGSYFHEESRTEYENFIVVCGAWSRRHTTALDYSLYVFDKNGGVPYTSSLTEEMKWEVSSDEKVITTYYTIGNTFRRFNKLNGTEKVYDQGMYKKAYDIENRKTIDFEKVE